jgi:DNA-binding CsgD family transcriptional regulator
MLTAREMQVLRLLAQGCSYADVAKHLGISVHTVGTHVENTHRKLSVHTAAAAVARAVELGLLTLKLAGNRRDAGCDIGAHVDDDGFPGWLQRSELALEKRGGHVAVPALREP